MTDPGPPTVLVTGATDGLGRALAHRLADSGIRLVLHGRHPGRLQNVIRTIAETGAEQPRGFVADFAELGQVAELARTVRERVGTIDALVNNAGIGPGEPDGRTRRTSVDGHELRFAVNYLAGFLLTELLVEPLVESSADGVPSRVVTVASAAQTALDFDDLMLEHDYSGPRAYGQSKLASIMHGVDLAGRVPFEKLTVNSLHPGTYMPTKIVSSERGSSIDSLETGVESVYRLALDPELDRVSGQFFDRENLSRAQIQAYNEQSRARLRERSLELVGEFLDGSG